MSVEPTVTYSVREILAKQDGKLDTIILQLGGKAEAHTLTELERRVTILESNIVAQGRVNAALRTESATNFSRREKVIGVLLAVVALAVQVYVQLGG